MQNPIEIRVAVLFAVVFVGLKVATGVAGARLGGAGVMALAGLAGLADVDPFVLSLVQGTQNLRLVLAAVIVAVAVNTLAKGVYFAALSREARRGALTRYGVWAALHVAGLLVMMA